MHITHTCGDVQVDMDARVAFVRGERVTLTYYEFELLVKFVTDPGRVFNRDELHGERPGAVPSTPRSVDIRVMRLRKKLSRARSFVIETVPKVGYRCWGTNDGQLGGDRL